MIIPSITLVGTVALAMCVEDPVVPLSLPAVEIGTSRDELVLQRKEARYDRSTERYTETLHGSVPISVQYIMERGKVTKLCYHSVWLLDETGSYAETARSLVSEVESLWGSPERVGVSSITLLGDTFFYVEMYWTDVDHAIRLRYTPPKTLAIAQELGNRAAPIGFSFEIAAPGSREICISEREVSFDPSLVSDYHAYHADD